MLPFEWYSLEVERRLRDAKMIINGKDVIKGKAPGSTRGLNIRMDVYFGGFDGETVKGNWRSINMKIQQYSDVKSCPGILIYVLT